MGSQTAVNGASPATPLNTLPVKSEKPHIYAGLEGVVVSETSVSTVGIPSVGLTYRGYAVTQLISKSTFEESALLLIEGELPSAAGLANFRERISEGRNLPDAVKSICESLSRDTHPMCVVSACVAYFGAISKNDSASNMCARLIGLVPSCLTYWYKYSHDGVKINTSGGPDISVAAHFLATFYGKPASATAIDAFSASLIAYAEHDLNASTFSARVTCSTLADYYSCIVSAINTLKGPLHGGANEAALKMLQTFPDVESVAPRLTEMLAKKEKIMGFGHRVYKTGDPRSTIMKNLCTKLLECEETPNRDFALFAVAETLETEMITRKNIYPNLDFYASYVYNALNIPKEIYTVIFAMGRLAGWSAHIDEQNRSNKLIRPKSYYVGEPLREYK